MAERAYLPDLTAALQAARETALSLGKPIMATAAAACPSFDPVSAFEKAESQTPAVKVAKKVAKAVTKDLPAVGPVVALAMKEFGQSVGIDLDRQELELAVKDAVKQAVKEAVRDAVQDVVEPELEEAPVPIRAVS